MVIYTRPENGIQLKSKNRLKKVETKWVERSMVREKNGDGAASSIKPSRLGIVAVAHSLIDVGGRNRAATLGIENSPKQYRVFWLIIAYLAREPRAR